MKNIWLVSPRSKMVSLEEVPRNNGVIAPMSKEIVASKVFGTRQRRSKMSSGAASVKMMPIGVPKVAYRVPGSQGADW